MGFSWFQCKAGRNCEKVCAKGHIGNVPSNADDSFRSAFELLRYPGVTTMNLKAIIPALSDIDPYILTRIDVDGR